MVKVSNKIPDCSVVVSELLNRAVLLGALKHSHLHHRINQLSRRAIYSQGDRQGETIRDVAAEAVIRGMLSTHVCLLASQDVAELFRLRNKQTAKGFLFEVMDDKPETWNAVKASLVRSCSSLVLSGGIGAACMFDALHSVLDGHRRVYRYRELSALIDAAETALALPV